MNGPVEWFGAIGAIIAAGLIAADLGRRVTGWAFVLFCAVSVAWIASGLANHTPPITVQNAILLAINAWGVWQFLLNPKKKKVIDRLEPLAAKIEREVATEKP
ncbi:MAG: hypothetical protein ABIT09_11485 [Croceibacterium sp.]